MNLDNYILDYMLKISKKTKTTSDAIEGGLGNYGIQHF